MAYLRTGLRGYPACVTGYLGYARGGVEPSPAGRYVRFVEWDCLRAKLFTQSDYDSLVVRVFVVDEIKDLEMRPEKLQSLRRNGKGTLLDVRKRFEREIAALDDDLWIPVRKIPERTAELIDVNKPLVVYCHRGIRSLKIADFLRERELEDVYSLAGGIDYWARKIETELEQY